MIIVEPWDFSRNNKNIDLHHFQFIYVFYIKEDWLKFFTKKILIRCRKKFEKRCSLSQSKWNEYPSYRVESKQQVIYLSNATGSCMLVFKILLGWIWWCFTRRKIKNIKIFFTLYIYFELLAHPQEYMDWGKNKEQNLFDKKTNCLFW